MKIIGHIGIRTGSKGVKNKNLRNFNGAPLFLNKLNFLYSLKFLDKIIISCDSFELLDSIEDNDKLIKIVRSKDLATDNANKWDVFKDSNSKFNNLIKDNSDIFVDFDVTVPNLTYNTVYEFYNFAVKQNKVDCIITAYESERNPYFNMVTIENDFAKIAIKPDKIISSRQSAPKVLSLSPAIYWIKTDSLNKYDHWSESIFKVFEIPRIEAHDIDNEFDFFLCKKIKEFYDI
jgi:CMP-N,N'-diacetyllegionaminic acid synthase